MTSTHIDIDDELLGRAAGALGTEQKKDTVEAAPRAAVATAEKDEAWAGCGSRSTPAASPARLISKRGVSTSTTSGRSWTRTLGS